MPMTEDFLYYLYQIATEYGGELHADSDEVALCFPNQKPFDPESPKRQDEQSWTATFPASSIPAEPAPTPAQTKPRRAVLDDMNQFLKEQEMNHLNQSLYEDGRKQQRFRTGEMPFRNYPEGRPPNR